MNNTLVTLQQRGQITLPKKYRQELGMREGAVLKTSLVGKRIVVEPVEVWAEAAYVRKPPISRQEYLTILERMAKSGKVLWTKADDKRRQESLRKERSKWKKLNW